MKKLLSALALAAALLLPGGEAAAQSCPRFTQGLVLTPGQWQACFDAKQNALGYVPVNKAGDVMVGKLVTFAPTTVTAGLNLPQGTAPTSPNNGDLWATSSGLYVRIAGTTVGPLTGGAAGSFAATAPIGVTFPSGVVTYALSYDANFSNVAGNLALASGGVAYPSSVTGGAKGAGTINASGLYVNGTAVNAAGITALTGDVTASGPGSAAATLATAQPGAHTWAAVQTFTLAPVFTDASGTRTALGLGALATVTPGTGVATALAVNVGTAGAFVVNGGALGTPSSGTVTNLTGTASININGTVGANTPAAGSFTTAAVGGCTIGTDVLCVGTGTAKFTGSLTISAAPLITSGNFSAAAWTTAGVRVKSAAASYTDTSSSGTVAAAYTDLHGAGTILASSSTTYTNYFGAYFVDPVASTNVTMTNKWALGADSAKFGTSNQVTISLTGVITATSPVFTTPTLGAATATSINGLIVTTTAGTLTIANNASASLITSGNFGLTLTSTATTNATFPAGTQTLAALTLEDQTLSGGANVTSKSQSTGNITVDCGARPLQYITNNGAWTITAPASDGSCYLLVTNGASAATPAYSGFSVGSNTGDTWANTNGNKYFIAIVRINSVSTYSIKAAQ